MTADLTVDADLEFAVDVPGSRSGAGTVPPTVGSGGVVEPGASGPATGATVDVTVDASAGASDD